MNPPRTLIELVRSAATAARDGKGYTFLTDRVEEKVSFPALWETASLYSAAFAQQGIQKGDRVLIALPTGPEFAFTFFGLIFCGAVPCVVASPPAKGTGLADGMERLRRIGRQIGAQRLLVTAQDRASWATDELGFQVGTVEEFSQSAAAPTEPTSVSLDDIAIIQASSGSTGAPKCVALTHRNVTANLEQIGRRLEFRDDVVVCWLPLFHDMGLVGCFLMVTYWQLHGVFLSPMQFLRRPVSWLRAISHYRGTVSPAPNFAYALATAKVPEAELSSLDLSSWRKALFGAEPIEVRTLASFTERFRVCGLSPTALVPCFGLAECTLAVSMHRFGTSWQFERISRTALASESCAIVSESTDAADTIEVVDCGPPMDGTEISIVDESEVSLPEGHVGRVYVSSPSVMQGYCNLPQEQTMRGNWLDTGDLGYLRAGHLFITGRRKDLVIIRGEKYLPSDFEQAAAEVPGISPGRVVAFGVSEATTGTEGLYVVCEQRSLETDLETLRQAVCTQVARRTGVLPAHVGFVSHNAIPRTTSGKLQRGRTKTAYLASLAEAGKGASAPTQTSLV